MIITFAGHSDTRISKDLSERIKNAIISTTKNCESVSFYLGGYGNFDNHCAMICREIKSTLPHCEIIFVTPYITIQQQEKMKQLLKANIYDSTLYPPIENTPPKFAISKRNEWMISEADLVICYVRRDFGGAYKSLCYAKRKNKRFINLAE